MYFSFRRILLMVLVHHFVLPAPVRMPSDSLFPAKRYILLVMAFLISPYGLPMAAIWLLGKVQDLKFAIQDLVYG